MNDSASEPAITDDPDACPLSRPQQTRNMLLFAACMGLNYLAAPISYVGIVQASLCDKLQATPVQANLPLSFYMGFAIAPLFITWFRPKVSQLKSTLIWCFLLEALMTAAVPFVLASVPTEPDTAIKQQSSVQQEPTSAKGEIKPDEKKNLDRPSPYPFQIFMIIAHAALFGATNPTAVALCWEVLGRGVDPQRRGWALSMAFGAGPFLAVIGSLISQLLLTGELWGLQVGRVLFPWNFISLYAAVAPMMACGMLLSSQFIVPLPEVDREREPFIQGIFGGLWKFLCDRMLLTIAIVVILIYMGNAITANMNLYSPSALGDSPDKYAGIQNSLRFGFKVIAGIGLGWLVTRTNPKAGLLTTAGLFVIAQIWAMIATGPWYLLAFGIFGMGELAGVYAPNYILAASRKSEIRRNQAFHTLMMMPASGAAAMFGYIAQNVGDPPGSAIGYRTSFAVCAAMMATGILITLWKLPANPNPVDEN